MDNEGGFGRGVGGPGAAQAELVACLRRCLTDLGMRQADLAQAAGVSKATVSNVLAGRSVPTVETLEMLARALGVNRAPLRELRQLRERADVRFRRLDGYLAAARGAALEQPYLTALGSAAPPLAEIYLQQEISPSSEEPAGAEADDGTDDVGRGTAPVASQSAGEVLAGERTCVVIAGPGGGKSSLLRTRLAAGIDEWSRGHGEGVVPILIEAAALNDRPFVPALTAAVNASLAPYGLVDELPTEFFRSPPQPNVRWLVLIDGLDELLGSAARTAILRRIAALTAGDHGDLFRFVVATRPLPDTEFSVLGQEVPRYRLEPFTYEDLLQVARRWFQALNVLDPDIAAIRFVSSVDDRGLGDLARIPLMAAMLCQLYAAAPEDPLPEYRSGIYRRFVDLLHANQYAVTFPRSSDPVGTGLERYGAGALEHAERTLDHLQELVARLAALQFSGDHRPPGEILAEQAQATRPPRVPPAEWRDFLDAALRRTGLLAERLGELNFLHQTFLEYLTACHAVRDVSSRQEAVAQIFTFSTDGTWLHPRMSPSYLSFLLDGLFAPQHPDSAELAEQHLSRLVANPSADDMRILISLIKLRTRLPAPALAAALALFVSSARVVGHSELDAAYALAQLEGHRQEGVELLLKITEDARAAFGDRIRAGRLLNALGDRRGVEALGRLTLDESIDMASRLRAARSWALVGDERGRELLFETAAKSSGGQELTFDRVKAARYLAFIGDDRAGEVLLSMIMDDEIDPYERAKAAADLAEWSGHEREGAARVARLVYEPGMSWTFRRAAAVHLRWKIPAE